MKRAPILSASLAVIASVVLAGSAMAAPFMNGSFEQGTDPGAFTQVNPGQTNITGWTVNVAVDYIGTYWPAPDGSRSIDMNASPSEGSISQAFDTTVNNTYVVQFLMSGNPNCGAGDKTMTVQATGGPTTSYTYTVPSGMNNGDMTWTKEGYSFRATASTSTLTFTSTTPNSNCGPALDAVSVTQTAATGAMCKDGGWQSMLNPDTLAAFKNQGACVSYYATSGAVPIGS